MTQIKFKQIVFLQSVLLVAASVQAKSPSQFADVSSFAAKLKSLEALSNHSNPPIFGDLKWEPSADEALLAITKPTGLNIKNKKIDGTNEDRDRFQFRALLDDQNQIAELRVIRFDRNPQTKKYRSVKLKIDEKTSDYLAFSVDDLNKHQLDPKNIVEVKNEKQWLKDSALKKKITKEGLVLFQDGDYQIIKLFVSKSFNQESGGKVMIRVLQNGWEKWYFWFVVDLKKDVQGKWIFEKDRKDGRNQTNLFGLVKNFDYIFFKTREVGLKEVKLKQKTLKELLEI